MSVNIPPNPNVSTFNNLYWIQGDNSLTTAEGDLRYLKFPVAQGTENLQTTNVNGVLTANSGVNFTSVNPPTSSQVIPASNDSSTNIPTTAWVQSAITAGSSNTLTEVLTAGDNAGNLSITNLNNIDLQSINGSAYPPIVAADTLTDVLIAGNNAGASDIDMNNNDINSIGILNVLGGINQTDSNYVNTTISTGSFTQVSGGSVTNGAGTNSSNLTYNKLVISDSVSGVNEMGIDKSSITYDNDTGNGDQLIISSNTTGNPILIQSNCGTSNGGGVTIEATASGADIIIQTTSSLSPLEASNIQLITNTPSTLGTQSSVILDTDLVFVRNGAMRIMNDRNNFLTGLTMNEVTANNFQINNTAGTLTLGATINNIILSSTQTTIQGVISIIQTTYPPIITNALGYTIQKTFGPANISDTIGTYSNIGSQNLPAVAGVYSIVCGFTTTSSGADTLEEISILLSLTSGTSGTEVNAYGGWRYYTEINDVMGAAGLRYVGVLCGTYINSTGTSASLFLNGYGKTTGAVTMSVQGNCSITRVG